jgi:2-keto-4-pentenoate hydratase
VVRRGGPVAGWKVGARSASDEPFRGALNPDTVSFGPTRLPADRFNVIGVEGELVYRMARPLPPRDRPYSRDEVVAAIAAVHAAIEIVDTRFATFGSVDPLSQVADQMNHGALIVGSGRDAWHDIDPLGQAVTLHLDGKPAYTGTGGNSAGEPLRLIAWLANGGAHGLGGLKAGDVITTGSCTGTIFVKAGTHAVAAFPGIGTAELTVT